MSGILGLTLLSTIVTTFYLTENSPEFKRINFPQEEIINYYPEIIIPTEEQSEDDSGLCSWLD